jgi:hypothetical protein
LECGLQRRKIRATIGIKKKETLTRAKQIGQTRNGLLFFVAKIAKVRFRTETNY